MARRYIIWTSRKTIYQGLMIVLAVFLLAVVLFTLLSTNSGIFTHLSSRGQVWKFMLQQNVPGLEVVQEAEDTPLNGQLIWQRLIWTLTDVDIHNPKTYLQSQIAGLKVLPDPLWEALEKGPPDTPEVPAREEVVLPGPHRLEYTVPYSVQEWGDPQIVIYHTHTTESFVPTSNKRFTENLELTVARLGRELADILQEKYRIPVLHDQTIHDLPRRDAYENAQATVKRLLEENPDLKIVIDLHRDGVARKLTTAEWGDEKIGKILLVVGTGHPNWQDNYKIAMDLHEQVETLFPGISRGVRKKVFAYNQHFHPRALLIEVGGHENSLEEVLRTIPLLAEAIAEIYNSLP